MKVAIPPYQKKQGYGFDEVLCTFADRAFDGDRYEAEAFLETFEDDMNYYDLPFDYIVLNVFTGDDSFSFIFKDEGGSQTACLKWRKRPNGTLERIYEAVTDKGYTERWKNAWGYFLNTHNEHLWKNALHDAEIADVMDCAIEFVEYIDYKPKETLTEHGSLAELFETYTNLNDRLRYVNGHYWEFKDKRMARVYSLYASRQKGNYFLNCAVKRGALID